MSGKNQYPVVLNWQSTSPVTGFLPTNNQTTNVGSVPSGVVDGPMASTNTIYSQIIDMSRMDNVGAEVNYTGTGTGTIQVMGSNSGTNFYPLTFDPALSQPAGSTGGYLIDLNQYPFKYMMIQYTNSTGTGTLTVYLQNKDLN
jgi:hypothetical protein